MRVEICTLINALNNLPYAKDFDGDVLRFDVSERKEIDFHIGNEMPANPTFPIAVVHKAKRRHNDKEWFVWEIELL